MVFLVFDLPFLGFTFLGFTLLGFTFLGFTSLGCSLLSATEMLYDTILMCTDVSADIRRQERGISCEHCHLIAQCETRWISWLGGFITGDAFDTLLREG